MTKMTIREHIRTLSPLLAETTDSHPDPRLDTVVAKTHSEPSIFDKGRTVEFFDRQGTRVACLGLSVGKAPILFWRLT